MVRQACNASVPKAGTERSVWRPWSLHGKTLSKNKQKSKRAREGKWHGSQGLLRKQTCQREPFSPWCQEKKALTDILFLSLLSTEKSSLKWFPRAHNSAERFFSDTATNKRNRFYLFISSLGFHSQGQVPAQYVVNRKDLRSELVLWLMCWSHAENKSAWTQGTVPKPLKGPGNQHQCSVPCLLFSPAFPM